MVDLEKKINEFIIFIGESNSYGRFELSNRDKLLIVNVLTDLKKFKEGQK